MFKYLKLKSKIEQLEKQNKVQRDTIAAQEKMIDMFIKEISRRDQKIIEQQKRMRFFGIEIGNEEYEAEKLDFPSTIKI